MRVKNSIKQTLFLILLLCNVQFAFGQENYTPGYIVKSNKDTLKGFIDYRNWGVNPKKISFKENQSAESSSYTPIDIAGFGISG